jgi:MoxR-like ATPase
MMERIIKVHYPDIENKLVKEALKRFYWIREIDGLRKKPSTSELLDWIKALALGGINIEKVTNEIPFLGTLLKTEQDTERFVKLSHAQGGLGFKRRY